MGTQETPKQVPNVGTNGPPVIRVTQNPNSTGPVQYKPATPDSTVGQRLDETISGFTTGYLLALECDLVDHPSKRLQLKGGIESDDRGYPWALLRTIHNSVQPPQTLAAYFTGSKPGNNWSFSSLGPFQAPGCAVELVDVMPYVGDSVLRGDKCICDAARLSTSKAAKTVDADIRLLTRLMNDNHTSPFEAAELKFIIDAPIFVARQMLRHRTASVNEFSFRFTELPTENFYSPTSLYKQSQVNKQLSETDNPIQTDVFEKHNKHCEELYQSLIFDEGSSREIARLVLPMTTMTRFMFKIDLHNFMKFLSLRTKPDVQRETKLLAFYMGIMAARVFPITMALWAAKEYKALWVKKLMAQIDQSMENPTVGQDLVGQALGDQAIQVSEYGLIKTTLNNIRQSFIDIDGYNRPVQ